MFWLIVMLVWNFTFSEPSDEQLTGQGKMKSSCLTQRWPLKVRKRCIGHCFGSPLLIAVWIAGVLEVYMTGGPTYFFALKIYTLGIFLGQEICHIFF